ncbi:MAG: tetratricopeptide repeat protein, partial [Pseudomonas sp.]
GLGGAELQAQLLSPLLDDPVRAVRIAAVWQLAQLPAELRQGAQARWRAALGEYEAVQNHLRERAEANFNLAMLYLLDGRPDKVETALREALQRDARFHPARVMLAQWLERQGRAAAALDLLREGCAAYPQDAALRHALGLALVRRGEPRQALAALAEASELAPDNSDYAYVYAVALHDTGSAERARAALHQQLERTPGNRAMRLALLSYAREAGQLHLARQLLEELKQINPGDPALPLE